MSTPDVKQIIKDEYLRCSHDPVHAIKKYVKIEHPMKGLVPFNLFDFQIKTLQQFVKHRFNIILKSRQMGISTLVAAYALMKMLFNNNYKVLVIATNQEVAKNLVHKVKVMYSKLPSWLKMEVLEDNKLAITFKNGSTIKAVSSSPTAGRSEALSLLIIDEAAFIDTFEEIWTSAQLTLATGGDAIVLSTPNGVGNLFFDLWQQAEDGSHDDKLTAFNPIRLKWDLHPERDQTWRDQQTLTLGARKAGQECVAGETKITIRNSSTGLIETITIDELKFQLQTNQSIIDIIPNTIYEVLTPFGFEKFDGLKITKRLQYIDLKFSDNTSITCTSEHRFFINGKETFASDIKVNDKIDSNKSTKIVSNITHVFNTKNEYEDVSKEFFDLFNVENHIYYTNDLLSHNCDTDFLTSGHTVVDGDVLQWYFDNMLREPLEKRGLDGNMWIWKYPESNCKYIVSVDVARGDGGDDSAIQVINATKSEQSAEWIGQVSPRDLGRMAVAIAMEYNTALLIIENKNVGFETVQEAITMNYPNIHYSFRNDVYIDPSIHIVRNYDLKDKKDMVPGFTTNHINRPIIIQKLEMLLEQKIFNFYSSRLYHQLLSFVWLKGKAQAGQNKKDDAVMALGIGIFVKDTALLLKDIGIEMTERALKHVTRKTYSDQLNKSVHNSWSMRDSRGNIISTKWLL